MIAEEYLELTCGADRRMTRIGASAAASGAVTSPINQVQNCPHNSFLCISGAATKT
jgi:hypothetical protein